MGIQISGLLSGQAFDWKSVVDQLIAADSIPVNTLQKQKTINSDKSSALADINTTLQALQDSAQSIRSSGVFSSRAVSSDNANTSWKSASSSGAQVGSYKIAVSQLATAATISGTTDIGQGLAPSNVVTGVTLSSMNTPTAVTAGIITVAGKQVTIATGDSLQTVFDNIALATGNTVTGSYTPSTTPNDGGDKITLTSSSGELILGAANDTSNFLSVMKLVNNGTNTTTSSSSLGIVKTSATLTNAGLRTAPTGDVNGDGAFTVNGKSVSYNINTDSISSIIQKINSAGAAVTASYDSAADQIKLTNNSTGDVGISIADTSGNLLAALGLGAGTFTHGNNAKFTVNGGPTLTSTSNTLDSSVHGIAGLSVTVNSPTTETITVASDVGSMQTSIQDLLTKFNAVQDKIETVTKISVGGGSVTTSVLSDNHEVQAWAQQLQNLMFNQVTGLTGSITHLDDLGIDFDGTSGHLVVKDQAKLSNALDNKPDDVQAYFLSGANGLVPALYGTLTDLTASDLAQQDSLTKANTDVDTQITTMQARLDNEREQLTNSFIAMLDAQSAAQSQNTSLTNQFFKNSG